METPHILIDCSRMMNNIRAMATMASSAGVKLRPHAKTHKMPSIAHMQLGAGATGITVAKISEAEVMAQGGIGDIFIAFPIVSPCKIDRAVELSRRIKLLLAVDCLEHAERFSEAARRSGCTIEVRLEVDTGMRRTGISADGAVEAARRIAELPGVRLSGLYTYRGAIFEGKPTMDLKRAGEEEGKRMVELADRLRLHGIQIDDVSVGSTPTAAFAARVPGITEVRPGTYVFQDRMQARFGVCKPEDWAVSVRVTVVSRPSADLAIIDGGSKTFATDVQPRTEPLSLEGYGHVLELEDACLERMSEEHGMLRLGPVAQSADLRIGDILHIVPNHVCSTINLHNHVVMLHEDGREEAMPVLARGMLE